MEENQEINNKKDKMQDLILFFFVYGFLGWLLEVVYAIYTEGHLINRGFLYGPICPIYGFGALILIYGLENINKNKFLKFIFATVTFSAFEYVVSLVLEVIFHQRWWDYSGDILNIQGRISLFYSIAWGIIGLLFTERIHPFVKKRLKKILEIESKYKIIIIIILLSIICIDEVLSIIKYLQT